uniref:LOB domain-containing protein n=1 Tax=Leersia perrieri TaxID=77586 RepID=A0A0D9V7A8_9ORYZ
MSRNTRRNTRGGLQAQEGQANKSSQPFNTRQHFFPSCPFTCYQLYKLPIPLITPLPFKHSFLPCNSKLYTSIPSSPLSSGRSYLNLLLSFCSCCASPSHHISQAQEYASMSTESSWLKIQILHCGLHLDHLPIPCPQKTLNSNLAFSTSARERHDEIGKKIKREPDSAGVLIAAATTTAAPIEHRIVPHRVVLGGAVNTVTPCAACKLLRRRCAQECPFAPYFSPHEPHKFAAVHKVFGASNVSKMLLEVGEAERADAASSLVYEANLRLRDPVYGCMGAISMLQQQVNALEAELEAVRAEIFKHRYRQAGVAGAAGLMVDDVHGTAAGFVAPAHPPPMHSSDVVSVVEAAGGQELAGAVAPVISSASPPVYADGQPSSSGTDYSSLNTSEHTAYFG